MPDWMKSRKGSGSWPDFRNCDQENFSSSTSSWSFGKNMWQHCRETGIDRGNFSRATKALKKCSTTGCVYSIDICLTRLPTAIRFTDAYQKNDSPCPLTSGH